MSQIINYTLPEFAFLDGQSHEGNTLEARTVLLHVRTHTVIECIANSDVIVSDIRGIKKTFIYINKVLYPESHTLVVHHSYMDAPEQDQLEILDHAWQWYEKYLEWEDKNIETDNNSSDN